MGDILLILLIIAFLKFILFGVILLLVFKPDFKKMWRGEQAAAIPCCLYCGSKYTHPVDEGQTRWEDDGLVLVTTHECEHCHLPFWNIEKISIPVGRSDKARGR